MGDFNAKVGADSHINWPSKVGKFGLGTGNERGERLLQFCALTRTDSSKYLIQTQKDVGGHLDITRLCNQK